MLDQRVVSLVVKHGLSEVQYTRDKDRLEGAHAVRALQKAASWQRVRTFLNKRGKLTANKAASENEFRKYPGKSERNVAHHQAYSDNDTERHGEEQAERKKLLISQKDLKEYLR